jgi:Ankyrin repeats (3 copies)
MKRVDNAGENTSDNQYEQEQHQLHQQQKLHNHPQSPPQVDDQIKSLEDFSLPQFSIITQRMEDTLRKHIREEQDPKSANDKSLYISQVLSKHQSRFSTIMNEQAEVSDLQRRNTMSQDTSNNNPGCNINPATAALLQVQLEQQKVSARRESASNSKQQPHVAQWTKIIDKPLVTKPDTLASSVVPSVASCSVVKRSSVVNASSIYGDDSDSSYDSSDSDESIDMSEDEEETRVAHALVRASYNGLSSAAIDRLIGSSTATSFKRKDRIASIPLTNHLQCQQVKQLGPADKKQRVTIHEPMNSIHRINSDWSAKANMQPSASRPIPASRSSVILTPGMLPTGVFHMKRTLNGSESTPALRFSHAGPLLMSSTKLSQEQQLSSSTAPPVAAVTQYVKPDAKLRILLTDAKMKEPQQIPFSSVSNFFTEMTPEAIAAYDIPIVQALRTENMEELRRMKEANKPMLCGNKFGETIMHAAARRRSGKVVEFLLKECNVTPRVCCDSGRTPLHDACWTVDTNFDVIDLLLDACPDLLYITDKRGFTPMSYVREELWEQWCSYLETRGAHKLSAKELFLN